MKETVILAGTPVELEANGGTPIRYKMLFGKDVITELGTIEDPKEDIEKFTEIVSRMAYVMYCQANGVAKTMSLEGYTEFCESFDDPMVFSMESNKIVSVYFKNLKSTSEAKNLQGPLLEK